MKAYKLIRKMKDGSLSPLFINQKSRIPIGVWMDAELHPKKGFAVRKGWHCTLEPKAPHLSEKNRVWVEVEIEDFEYYDRPESQGGTWVLAQRMRVIKEINNNIKDQEKSVITDDMIDIINSINNNKMIKKD
jgi:hypothetical protein